MRNHSTKIEVTAKLARWLVLVKLRKETVLKLRSASSHSSGLHTQFLNKLKEGSKGSKTTEG
jgi:hypothetical protein